jgi:hypothetical protein
MEELQEEVQEEEMAEAVEQFGTALKVALMAVLAVLVMQQLQALAAVAEAVEVAVPITTLQNQEEVAVLEHQERY